MKSFHEYMMRYRGAKLASQKKERELAEWMFHDHDFPKHSCDYDEISRYLEWNIPFTDALRLFDQLWEDYIETQR
ncbi:uncharacterized protein YozE (UPF0346 family) [Natronobacillus azotifigens]|uniref:YozE family protein n=1 Tax=Natronobacillus azotifigens TaxID=472978 RepID=A0A9J6R9C3_9BACI|nr:YozE family protein [Natronobacillus azotifigens]MCZ0701907.1 YozE family protein [Natronobacillus azotifigens]